MSVSDKGSRDIITPEGKSLGEEFSELADLELDKLNFFYAKNTDLGSLEGNFGIGDFDVHRDENRNLEDKMTVAKTFDTLPKLVNSIAVADEINDNVGAKNSLIMANEFSNSSNGQIGTGLDNSVVVGDYNNFREFQDQEFVDYGPFMRNAKNSTWIGDIATSPVFDKAVDNILHGDVGKQNMPVDHLFVNSDRNVVVGDEIYAENIGSDGVNLVVADEIESDNITSNTMILEGQDFQGSKAELANYFFKISNRSLSPFKAFDLEGSFEDWEEIHQEIDFANEAWSEVHEKYDYFEAAEKILPIPQLEGTNEEIYERLKQFQTNFHEINRQRMLDKNVIGVKDFFEGEKTIYFGDGENNFEFSYEENSEGFTQALSAIDDSIEEELNFFDFDGGEKPGDLIREIEETKEKSKEVQAQYSNPLALFENLDLEKFHSTEDIEERLNGFDQEIEEAAKTQWEVTENAAEGLVEAEETSYIIDILPKNLDQTGKDHYLQIVSNSFEADLDIEIEPTDLRDKEGENSLRDDLNIQKELHPLFESPVNPAYKAQMVNKIIEDMPDEADAQRKQIAEFTETLEKLNPETRDQLYNILKTDTDRSVVERREIQHEAQYSGGDSKFGNTLVEIGKGREYQFFVDDEAERIEELLDTKGDLPEADPFFEEDSSYREIIEELTDVEKLENDEESEYGEMSDQELAEKLRMVRGVGEKLGFEYDASNVFGMLKGKEGRRQNTEFEPEGEELESLLEDRRKELEKDVQSKLREYTKEGVKQLGFEVAADRYEKATGERPKNLSKNEIAALKVKERFERPGVQRTADKLLENQNDVYELEANQEWLEQHDFGEEELVDPDLSSQAEGEYRRPEKPEYNSELQVEIDSSDIQMDTEREKQQYWNEVTELLDRVGVEDEVEDIEEAEQVIEELEEPEDEQDYQELKDAINNYYSVENRAGGIPDELTLRVADPMDTTRMGQGFGSCHDIDGGSYAWASISNAVDANKMVFYAEDEQDRQRARVKAFITEDEELVYHNTSQYKDIDIDTSDYFEGYMERVSDELGLELKHSSEAHGWKERTELLEAHDWYSGS